MVAARTMMTALTAALAVLMTSITVAEVSNTDIVSGANSFGCDLSDALYTDGTLNIWTSPFCISSCFSLIYPGSNGETQSQIANVMGFPTGAEIDPAQVTQQFFELQSSIENTYNGEAQSAFEYESNRASLIGIVNKVFVSQSLTPQLKQSYIDSLNDGQESFIAYNFDFAAENATAIINGWVDTNTNGLINEIVDENADISNWLLVALNAIFLNASFAKQFQAPMTSQSKFYADGLRTTAVADIHLMHQMEYFSYYNDGRYQWIQFPFSDFNSNSNDLFALFALPIHEDLYANRNGLITDVEVVNTAIANLRSSYIALALPKLSVEAMYTLNDVLIEMGMPDAFDSNADLSGIREGGGLKIDVVIHKTMVEMDETGLVAAAVTLIAVDESAPVEPPVPILFKADHPFQLFIVDGEHDNAVLFMGQINEPGIPEGSDTPTYDESVKDVWNNFKVYQATNGSYMQSMPHLFSFVLFVLSACLC